MRGIFQLFTASVQAPASPTAVQISLITKPFNCPLDVLDPSPWASSDGKVLLFDSSEHYKDCNDKNTPLDMFVARPDDSGQVASTAEPIDVDCRTSTTRSRAFRRTCAGSYFASDRDGAKSLRLYRAHRR